MGRSATVTFGEWSNENSNPNEFKAIILAYDLNEIKKITCKMFEPLGALWRSL